MMSIVLRVQGATVDLDRSLAWIPSGLLQASWRPGDRRPGGRIREIAGFNVLLSEGEDDRLTLESATRNLLQVADAVAALVRSGAEASVDLGLFVEATSPKSVELDPEFLRALRAARVSIVVSAYPCSADDS